jgi:hypothetical protein
MIFIFVQIIGFVALAFDASSFQAKHHRSIMSAQIVAAVLYVVHFLLLGAITGAVLNTVSLIRAIVFRKFVSNLSKKRPGKRAVWPFVTILAIGLAASAAAWQGWLSLLATGGWIITTTAFWQRNEQRVRQLTLAQSPLWLAYDAFSGSLAGVLTEILISSSAAVGLWRFRRHK